MTEDLTQFTSRAQVKAARAEAARRARRRPAVPASVGGAVGDDRSEDGVGVARSSEEVTAARRSHSGTALRGDIEGLRAIAVGTVLLYHLGLPWLPGGFVGVDVFFVISGFLITSLLLRESTKTGTVSISDFYARRARRLLPAASTVLLFTAVVGWFVLPRAARGDLATDVVASTFYVVNWALANRSVDYLAEDSAPSPLQHYWSLSVEEQYYVVWPLMILVGLFLARRARLKAKPVLAAMLAATALASFGHSVLHTRAEPATAYFWTTTRVWELAIGALLAFLVVRLHGLGRWAAQALALAGLVLIGWSAVVLTSKSPWPGHLALLPTLGAAAIIAAGCSSRFGQRTAVARLLSLPPMTWIGGLSYAIYLWHWPLIILAKTRWPAISWPGLAAIGLLSLALAWVTKHVIEDPIRFNRALAARAVRGIAFGLAAMLVTGLSGYAVRRTVPVYDRGAATAGSRGLVADPGAKEWTVRADPQAVFTTSGRVTPDPALAPKDVPSYYADDCQVKPGDSQVRTRCSYGDPKAEKVIAIAGDSKMGQWFPAFKAIAKAEGWRLDLYLKSSCTFTSSGAKEDCNAFGRSAVAAMRKRPPDILVTSQGSGGRGDRVDGMVDVLSQVQQMGTKVVVLADNPTPPSSKVYDCVDAHPGDYLACAFPATDGAREGSGTPALTAAAKGVGVPVLDLNPWMCPERSDVCPAVIDGTLLYRQGTHITASYARTLTPMIYRYLARLGLTKRTPQDITLDDVPTGSDAT